MARITRARVLVTPGRIARLPKWAREYIEALKEDASGAHLSVDPERIERLPAWARHHIYVLTHPQRPEPPRRALKRFPHTTKETPDA